MLQKALKYLLHPTLKGIEDNALIKKVAIAQRLILITTLITIGYFFFYLSKNIRILAYTGTWDIAGYILCFILLKKGHLQTSRNLFVVFLNFNLFYSSLFLGQASGNQFWYIPVAAGTLIFFDSKESKRQILFCTLSLALLTIIEFIPFNLQYLTNISPSESLQNNKQNIIITLIVTVYCVYYAMRLFSKASQNIEIQNASLTTLIENMGSSIWQIDKNYKLVIQNTYCKKIVFKTLGRNLEIGENLLESSYEFEKNRNGSIVDWKSLYDRCLNRESFICESVQTLDGRIIYNELSFSPVIINNTVTGAIVNSKNITNKKEQEIHLIETSEKIKTQALVASTTPYGVIITDNKLNIKWVNIGFENITGYNWKEVLDKNIENLLLGNLTNQKSITELNTKTKLKKSFTIELINYKKNGEPFWMQFNITPQLDENNEILKYILIGIDITEKKQTEEQLNMLLTHSERINKELQTRDEDLQKKIRELNKQSWELQMSEEKLRNKQKDLESVNKELIENTKKLQEQYREAKIKNILIGNASKKLNLKAIQLEQASQYKSEFLANMSHELRTPLNSIIILSRLLAENKENTLNTKQQEFAKVVNKSGSDLLNLINDILDLSKIEAGKVEIEIEEITLNDLVEDLTSQFLPIAQDKEVNFKIIKNYNVDQIIKSDHLRLTQVLKNLLSNAFKFTPKNGEVDLVIKCENNNSISFKVIDTGIGIPEEKQNQIFESFKQVDGSISRKYGGTGLGLSISRELIRLLKGTITVSSKIEIGSQFEIKIPTGLEDTLNEINSNAEKTLLIIEDDEVFATLIENFAMEQGFKTVVCNRGDTGFMRIAEIIPSGILLDMNLPGMDGRSIMRKLQSDPILCKIPVHVISSKLKGNSKEELSAISWIQKPINFNKLKNIFESLNLNKTNVKSKVLVIEDSPEQSTIIRHLLYKQNIDCIIAETGEEALKLSSKEEFDCIILDLNLPDSDGLQILKKVKEDINLTQIPVIVYSARELTQNDKLVLRDYASSYVRKSESAFDLLMEETELFLQSVKEQKSRKKVTTPLLINIGNLSGKKILIVDDDARNIYALTSMLENYKMDLYFANTGKEAIEELDKNPDIDLVLMDIMMPEMNGLEATQKIRLQDRFSKLPIIALTAKAMKEDYQISIDAGMNEHITKPVESSKLLELMTSYFE